MNLSRASRFILCLVLSSLLVMGCSNKQEEASNKREEEDRFIPQKEEINKKNCFAAYKALKRIEAMVESGVTFQEYSRAVSAAKLEFNLIKESSMMAKKLKEVFDYYQKAKDLWMAKRKYDATDTGGPEVAKQLRIVKKLFPEKKIFHYRSGWANVDVERAMQLLWAKAFQLLKKYEIELPH
ncbi:MAG: hypothetical protein KAV83_07010 [Desulfobacterales bacterium]|nr:hypothetical protein [Desulfobacterales bacterium]